MNFLVSFAPWLGFAIVSTQADWRWSGLIGLVIAGVLVLALRRRGRASDTMIIELSALAFFAVLTAYSLSDPSSLLRDYVGALSDGWLALTAWGSIALGRPFTLGIAKTMTSSEVWQTPQFHRVNVVITAVWAASFTVAGAAAAVLLAAAPHATAALVALKVLGFAVPVTFTIRYSNAVRARAQKVAGHHDQH